MAKDTAKPDEAGPAKVATITLDEFCARLSETDRRTELIAGFHSVARQSGTLTGSQSSFEAAFHKFINTPV